MNQHPILISSEACKRLSSKIPMHLVLLIFHVVDVSLLLLVENFKTGFPVAFFQ